MNYTADGADPTRLYFVWWGSYTQSCVPGTPPTVYTEQYRYDYSTGKMISRVMQVTRPSQGVYPYLGSGYALGYNGTVSTITYPSSNSIQPVFSFLATLVTALITPCP